MFSLINSLFEKFGVSIGNRSKSPSNTSKISGNNNANLQANGDINIGILEEASGPKLRIVEGPSHSGGPNGFSFSFTIKNIGDQSALDIRWGYQADNLNFHDGGGPIPELSPRDSHKFPSFEYGSSKLFFEELSNPRIVLLYRDPAGNSKRDEVLIGQEGRDDGKYNVMPRV